MTIAYLVNRYPAVSHSFIRREILALEALGHTVKRFSIRPFDANLPDPSDRAEGDRTAVVLRQGAAALLGATVRVAIAHPLAFLSALRLTLAMAGGVVRRWPTHLAYLVEACWLTRALAGVDHLHAHFGTNPATVARLVRRLGGPPYSFTVHGPEEFDAPIGLHLSGKIADAARVVAISSFGRSQLMRWCPPDAWPRIAVVRCGVDGAFADAPPAPPAAAPSLCCVARLSGQKGLPLLIEAAALLKARGRDFHLTLVGDGELRGPIEQAIHAAGLTSHVTITGYLSADGVRERLLASRAMVLPSFAEGLPVVIMEALALRVPVIATAIAGIPELVDETCGWIAPAGSTDRLAATMEQALDADPARLRAMGEAGRARVLAAHDARRNAQALADLLGLA